MEQTVVEFCRFARESGIAAGVKESLEAVRAVTAVKIDDRKNFKFALRAVICSTKADWDIFDEVFEAFWSGPKTSPRFERSKRSKSVREQEAQQENAELAAMVHSSSTTAEGEEGKAVMGRDRARAAEESRFL